MRDNTGWDETFVEAKVTYHIEIEGTSILVRNVPARLNVETGERLFSPEIVERLQEIVRSERHPARLIETLVYEYG